MMKSKQETVVDEVISWRRHFHENPELSYQEHQTSEYIYKKLKTFSGLEVTRPTETSVLAVLKGAKKSAGKSNTIIFRADIDALPIEEEAEIEFKSKNPGIMHACGHDAHAAMLLGAAKVLSGKKKGLVEKSGLFSNMPRRFCQGELRNWLKKGLWKE